MRVVFCTTPKILAEEISDKILEARLAACVNIIDTVKSKYWWQGKLQTDEESLLIIKTTKDLIEPLTKKIKEIHPYDVPEVISFKIKDGNEDYLKWIYNSTKKE